MKQHFPGKMLLVFIIAILSALMPALVWQARGDEAEDRDFYRNRAFIESDDMVVCYRPGDYGAARGACVAWDLQVIRVDALGDYLVCRWRAGSLGRKMQVVAALDRHPKILLVHPVERPWPGFPGRSTLPPL